MDTATKPVPSIEGTLWDALDAGATSRPRAHGAAGSIRTTGPLGRGSPSNAPRSRTYRSPSKGKSISNMDSGWQLSCKRST